MALTRCISSLGCPECSLDELLALAARHGIDAVELRTLGGTVDLAGYFAAQFGTPDKLAARLRAAPVRVVSLDASLRLAAGSDAERTELLALVPWAEAAGIRWLRVFDGRGELPVGAAIAAAAESVRWWRAVRRERGVVADIMVETHDTLFTADAIARFVTAAPGTAILWDAHHTWRKGGEHPVETWRAIHPHVVHVHVKDSIPVPSARHPYTYRLPGDGDFPIAPLLAALRAARFAGVVSLEWERQWHPYLPSLDEALALAAARRWW